MSLYIISTPIGNLGDMTERAKQIINEVDILAAEDTRKASNLINHFGLSVSSLTAYNEHNKNQKMPEILNWLAQGKKVGIISNAGTPLISDPGYQLVRQAVNRGYEIISVPGPTALISALVISGFPPTRFSFLGFLPKSEGKKIKILKKIKKSADLLPTVIIYESPNRIIKTLKLIKKELGEISIVVGRELTKKHEQKIRGKTSQVINKLQKKDKIRGEITLVLKLK
jgi:16S rRNA (cytidine1402-2'-O)-methyltransferase